MMVLCHFFYRSHHFCRPPRVISNYCQMMFFFSFMCSAFRASVMWGTTMRTCLFSVTSYNCSKVSLAFVYFEQITFIHTYDLHNKTHIFIHGYIIYNCSIVNVMHFCTLSQCQVKFIPMKLFLFLVSVSLYLSSTQNYFMYFHLNIHNTAKWFCNEISLCWIVDNIDLKISPNIWMEMKVVKLSAWQIAQSKSNNTIKQLKHKGPFSGLLYDWVIQVR